ncbi:hypothetical protein [Psychrobacter sp. P11G5]|uniref:hypothetical protein n=1 Tax=Psychrobacter sp. P11G5 TaxID=1699624 RepID=UPI00078CEA0F|nr:hypothetical protein [Psychrobacter sp. P11G5]AMN68266.1 hypothetical protein AK825_11645 [Psychrobacter sp. P11G5]
MTTKQSILLRLPTILSAGVLSTGLVISGCSNNDNVETETAANSTENTTDVVEVSENDVAGQAELIDTDNAAESQQIAESSANKQKSLVTNPTEAGTPEDTVKKALDSLYDGDVQQAAGYYKVDMANFEEELAKTQSAFQQTVDGVTITDTKYNNDKTHATITGELMLKGQSEPAPLTYELQKIDNQWKILG